jgi:hypothetical protein
MFRKHIVTISIAWKLVCTMNKEKTRIDVIIISLNGNLKIMDIYLVWLRSWKCLKCFLTIFIDNYTSWLSGVGVLEGNAINHSPMGRISSTPAHKYSPPDGEVISLLIGVRY